MTVTFPAESGQADYTGLGGIIQTETGDLFFVMVDDDEGFGSNPYDDFPIESIQVTNVSAFGTQQFAAASDTQSFVPCFAVGTQIETPSGPVPVETLHVLDRVVTMDNGVQPIRWVGRRELSPCQLAQRLQKCPVMVKEGALGPGIPARDLVVSPQHRFLLASKITARATKAPEILVAAAKLVGQPGIRRVEGAGTGVQYVHFACDNHEVVWANSAPTETFLVGSELDKAIGDDACRPLDRFSPATALARAGPRIPVRPIVERGRVLRSLLERHVRNAKPLFHI